MGTFTSEMLRYRQVQIASLYHLKTRGKPVKINLFLTNCAHSKNHTLDCNAIIWRFFQLIGVQADSKCSYAIWYAEMILLISVEMTLGGQRSR